MRLGSLLRHLLLVALTAAACAHAQRRPMDVPDTTVNAPTQRTRLYLKDGTYQLVLSYKVEGRIVHYRSAEREGEAEDVPLALVDLPRTERWKREHAAGAPVPEAQTPVLSPELAKEEADRAALTPIVFDDAQQFLRLPELQSVLALDTFEGTPELIPLQQQGGDLNKETAHSILSQPINPASAPHRIAELAHYRSDIQLHVALPVFYVRVGDDTASLSGGVFTVDTHSSTNPGRATPSGGSEFSGYVVERLDVRYDSRVVESLRLAQLGTGRPQPDVIEMQQQTLPGGHWLKLTPVQPLDFGEYALLEVLSDHELNLNVWDFGVHSDAKENVEAIRPDPKRPSSLHTR
jgi:hypothetical protein